MRDFETGPFTFGECMVHSEEEHDGAAVFAADGQPFCLVPADVCLDGKDGALARAQRIAALLNADGSVVEVTRVEGGVVTVDPHHVHSFDHNVCACGAWLDAAGNLHGPGNEFRDCTFSQSAVAAGGHVHLFVGQQCDCGAWLDPETGKIWDNVRPMTIRDCSFAFRSGLIDVTPPSDVVVTRCVPPGECYGTGCDEFPLASPAQRSETASTTQGESSNETGQ